MPTKCRPLESYFPHNSRNTTLQGDEHGDQNIEDRFLNDPMEEDDVIDTNDEYEINRLIQDTFAPLDEDNLHDIHEGSTKNILSSKLLLVNLKVLNGLSNTCFTRLLRYLKFSIFLYF